MARPHRDLAAQLDELLKLLVLGEHRLRVALGAGGGQDAARGQARGAGAGPTRSPSPHRRGTRSISPMSGSSRGGAARTLRWALRSSSIARMSIGQSKETLAHPRAPPGPQRAACRRATSAKPLADLVTRSISTWGSEGKSPPPEAFPGFELCLSADDESPSADLSFVPCHGAQRSTARSGRSAYFPGRPLTGDRRVKAMQPRD